MAYCIQDYQALLEKAINDIENLLQEFDTEVMNSLTTQVPREFMFDAVPITKRLKEAKKEAKYSLMHIKSCYFAIFVMKNFLRDLNVLHVE